MVGDKDAIIAALGHTSDREDEAPASEAEEAPPVGGETKKKRRNKRRTRAEKKIFQAAKQAEAS